MRKPIITSVILSIALLMNTLPLGAQNVKFYALFVAKFTDYIQWPNSTDQIKIGIYGSQDVTDELKKYSANKKNIQVINVSNVGDIKGCQMVFLSNSKNGDFESLNAKTKGTDILIITEDDAFVKKGAGISFYMEGTKLRFKLNKQILDDKKLKVSGSLLSLAKLV